MNRTFAKTVYLLFAVTFIGTILFPDISTMVLGFVWVPLFVSFFCLHYLFDQKRKVASEIIPLFLKGVMWLGIITLSLVWIGVLFVFLAVLSGDGDAAWALIGAPFLLIPGVIAAIVFAIYKPGANLDSASASPQSVIPTLEDSEAKGDGMALGE